MAGPIGERAVDRADQDSHPLRAAAKGEIDQESVAHGTLVEDLNGHLRVEHAESVKRRAEALQAVERGETPVDDDDAPLVGPGELNDLVRSGHDGHGVDRLKERGCHLHGRSSGCGGHRPDALVGDRCQPIGGQELNGPMSRGERRSNDLRQLCNPYASPSLIERQEDPKGVGRRNQACHVRTITLAA